MSEGIEWYLQPGARYGLCVPAGDGEVFAPGSWDDQVGTENPVKVDGRVVAHVRIIAAEVAGDGSAVMLTYEVMDASHG